MSTGGSSALAAHAWKPGQSGNPAGLSRSRRELMAAIDSEEVPKAMELLRNLYTLAMTGDISAAKLWIETVVGKPKTLNDEEINKRVGETLAAMRAAVIASRQP